MYLWNTSELAAQLGENGLTDSDRQSYIMVLMLIFGPSFHIGIWNEPDIPSWLSSLDTVLLVAISLGGAFWCFRTNQLGDGRDFFERFCCLSVPLGIKAMFLVLALGVLVFMFIPSAAEVAGGAKTPSQTGELLGTNEAVVAYGAFSAISLFALIWYFSRISFHLKQIGQGRNASNK